MNPDDARNMARDLIAAHLDDTDWSFKWDNAKRRIGQCRWDRRTIQLSRPLVELNTVEEVRDTILHEIAHALVGAVHDHDRVWKAKARELGCQPTAAADSVVLPPRRWTAMCLQCGRSWGYYRRRRLGHCGEPVSWVERPTQLD